VFHRSFSDLYHPSHIRYSEGPTYQHISPSGLPGFLIALLTFGFGAAVYLPIWPWMLCGVIVIAAARIIASSRQRPKRWFDLDAPQANDPIHPK
jgi:hypothetical protein